MPRGPQAVEDQDIEAAEQRPGRVRDAAGVGAIGNSTEAEAEHVEGAVLEPQRHNTASENLERRRADPLELEPGHATAGRRRRGEGVVEGLADPGLHRPLAQHPHRPAGVEAERPHVVEAVDVVNVVVRVKHSVDLADVLPQKLGSEVGGRVNEKMPVGEPNQHARSRANIPRAAAEAGVTATPHERHAYACACAQEQEPPCKVSPLVPGRAAITGGSFGRAGSLGHGGDYRLE